MSNNEVKNFGVQNSKFITCQPAGWFDINSSLMTMGQATCLSSVSDTYQAAKPG
jgi:hypothetical protein